MKKLLLTLVLAAGVVGLGGAAFAADVPRPPPAVTPIVVVPQVYNWSGWYVGVQGGWDTNKLFSAVGPGFSSTASGGIAGIYAGINATIAQNWVWGVDASINWDGARATTTSPGCGCSFSAGPAWKGFVRGRLGFAADRLLFYGTLGGVFERYRVTGTGAATATDTGWTAGLGLDWALSSRLVGRFDWAYQNFGTFALSSGVPVRQTANTFTVGLALKM